MQHNKNEGSWIAVAYAEQKGVSRGHEDRADVIVRARTKRAAQKQLLQHINCQPENTRVRKVGRALYRLTVIYSPEGHKIYFLLNEKRAEAAQRTTKETIAHV